MTLRIGAATVGLGVGAAHAGVYARLPDCQLRWIFDFDQRKMEEVADNLGRNVRQATSYDQIIADPEVNVVSIASYDDAHYEQVLKALSAGKNVFVEKPLCRSSDELRTIKNAWIASDRPGLASNLALRAAPLYIWLREQIRQGTFGEIYAFDGDYLYGRLEKITAGWRGKVNGYSVIQGGGVHLVDLMLRLTGEKPSHATAMGNRICTRASDFASPDYVTTIYRFPSGLIGKVTANFGCVHPHQHVVRIFGTRATFIYDDQGARLHRGRDSSPDVESISLAALPASKGDLIPDFVRSLQDPPEQAAQHEFDVMSVCFAADHALSKGAEVSVTYV